MSPNRSEQIASLFRRRARVMERLVAARASVPAAVIEDACQTAWERLCRHPEVPVEEEKVALQWLVVTATREAWKRGRLRREESIQTWPADPDGDAEALDPVGEASDPCDLAIAREVHRERIARIHALTVRERHFLALQ